MAKWNFVKKARKAIPDAGIKEGDSYYWWKFRYGGKRYSKTKPKPSQLTQSGYLSTLYSIQESVEDLTASDAEDIGAFIENMKSELESLMDDCQNNLDNMPEHLQESSSSGELLQERIDTIESAISDLDAIDTDYDEPTEDDLKEEALDKLNIEDEDDDDYDEEVVKKTMDEIKEEKLQEWIDEKIQEIQEVNFE
jgi:hypothetical protein